ncbi:MBL fold metallo-hydrolase [Mycobacterium simiae]|uniref:MBL fold metallo-hydrolase n=1 Tax=Mycobacterium simiae TaxID=1784 RepID=UPI0020CAB84B|nr:MBL fold metallo-hydrolase [Mycobacterium simiae]
MSHSAYVVAGTNVNWALVSDGSGVTLIDAGHPADTPAVLDSVRQVGHQVTDVAAVLLTHAHLDHIGAIPAVVERVGMPVYTGSEEVRHAKRQYLRQITPAQMIQQLTTRRDRHWVGHTLRAVRGHIKMTVWTAGGGDNAALAALPGGPTALPSPGHTSAHTAYLLASEKVLFSGDALVTGHPLLAQTGPQPLPRVFNHDQAAARASAGQLANQPATTLVPGHGQPLRRNLKEPWKPWL